MAEDQPVLSETLPDQPYVGPRPFGRDDESIFFARDREANEVLSRLLAHPVVLLYAPSGAGKTSLLQARLIPLLEEEEKQVQVFGSARIRGEAVKVTAARNIFVFNALTSLAEKAAPADLGNEDLPGYLKKQASQAGLQGSLRVLIFDQFEEIFTSYPEHWEERHDFFEQVGQALDDDPRLRILFAMREEYIASLDPYARLLPERLQTRFRLEPLRRKAALVAVKCPVSRFGRIFTDSAAEKLVDNLLQIPGKVPDGMAVASGEFVEPVQLQVVCRRIWQSLPAGETAIDESYISSYGDVDQALAEYYEDCLRRVTEKTGAREWILRNWFEEQLITPERTRGLVFREKKATRGIPNEWVDLLEDLHLIRTEIRGGWKWHELAHDRFIQPILRSNREKKRAKRLSDQELKAVLELRAYNQAQVRRLSTRLGQPSRFFYKYINNDGSPEEAAQDWVTAEQIFALEVLEGKVHLTRSLEPDSYPRLEKEWLSDVKRTKAYLVWEERAGPSASESPDPYYFEACKSLRDRLADPEAKALLSEFDEVEPYLRSRYLAPDGSFDPQRPAAEEMIRIKAQRISTVGRGRDDLTNWFEASDYAWMFYGNIIRAVKDKDEESTLLVLKAFQFSRAPENRYLIINCFEAAIALYFLDAAIVQRIWKGSEGREVPPAYTVSTVETTLPQGWAVPERIAARVSFDGPDRLVLRGVLREDERDEILTTLPKQYAGPIEELFQRSRLLPEETTL